MMRDDALKKHDPLRYQPVYRRNLPHIQPPGALLFVNFHLAGSLPVYVIERLREEAEANEKVIEAIEDKEERECALYREQRRQFGRLDGYLDAAEHGPLWLKDERVAANVAEALHFRDGKVYDLEAFCIMPNHVHTLFTPLEKADGSYYSLNRIMHSLKRISALNANNLLGRTGPFWQAESYDHIVRDPDERLRIIRYILNNPVKAGLVDDWTAWPWTYLKEM